MQNLSEPNRKALLVSLHDDIHKAARQLARIVLEGKLDRVNYPPNLQFSPEEVTALSKIGEIPGIQSALEKIFADAAASVIFGFLNYIDGTGDPALAASGWTEVDLVDRDHAADGGEVFLHTAFYDTYWNWRDANAGA
jgi:hypothetical protein